MKTSNLLLLLLITSPLKIHSIATTHHPSQSNTPTLQQGTWPDRVKKLLDKQKGNFNKIEHYYTWKTEPLTIGIVIFFGLFIPITFGLGLVLITAFVWHKQNGILSNLGLFILGLLPLLASAFAYAGAQDSYESSIHPGCFCLTDKGLIIIPNGTSNETFWIPYEDILYINRYSIPSPSSVDDHERIAIQEKHLDTLTALVHTSQQEGSSKQELANLLAMLETEFPYMPGDDSRLWIVFVTASGYCLNCYCKASAFTSEEDYEQLYNLLREKIRKLKYQHLKNNIKQAKEKQTTSDTEENEM